MRAVQYREIGKGPEVVEIDVPSRGPAGSVLKVTAAGLCHSDWLIMDLPEEQYIYGLPLTLGHEGAGIVDKLGAGVRGHRDGRVVVVYGPWGWGSATHARRPGELLHPCGPARHRATGPRRSGRDG